MTHKTGIIILGTDTRRAVVKDKPVRIGLIGESPDDFEGLEVVDWLQWAEERNRLRNASALYVGLGRWGIWFYWRRRPLLFPKSWLAVRDIRAEHIQAEAAR